jgi:hypothetical protein
MSQIHFNHIEIMLIHQKNESEVFEGDQVHFQEGGLTLMVLVQKQLEQKRQTVV